MFIAEEDDAILSRINPHVEEGVAVHREPSLKHGAGVLAEFWGLEVDSSEQIKNVKSHKSRTINTILWRGFREYPSFTWAKVYEYAWDPQLDTNDNLPGNLHLCEYEATYKIKGFIGNSFMW